MLKPGNSPPPLVSVDIPSGWHVENGDERGSGADSSLCIQHGSTQTLTLAQEVAA